MCTTSQTGIENLLTLLQFDMCRWHVKDGAFVIWCIMFSIASDVVALGLEVEASGRTSALKILP